MTTVSRISATLIIIGDDLDPSEITMLLGSEPHEQHRKGDPRPAGRDGCTDAPFSSGMWSRLAADEARGDLDAQIASLMDPLTDDPSTWLTVASRYRAYIFIGLFLSDGNEGVELSPATLRLVADRHLALSFDIYGGIGV